MIEFQNVSKKFGVGVSALDDVSFVIDPGSFVFLVGPTGSGKTTILRLIIRDLLPTHGTVLLGEWNLNKLPGGKVPHLRRKIGMVFQDLKLLMDRTVLENVILPLQITGVAEKEAKQKAQELLMIVGLGEKIEKFPLQLSGGEKQRVAIARALIYEPEVILADEPTGNLDRDTSIQIIDVFESINKQRGTTILMATHNTELIDKTKKRVIGLRNGKIVEDKKHKEDHKSSDDKKSETGE